MSDDTTRVMARRTVDGTRYELVTETPYCTRCGREWSVVPATAEVEVAYYPWTGGQPSAMPVKADPLGDMLRATLEGWSAVMPEGFGSDLHDAGATNVRCSEGHEWSVEVWARLADHQPAVLAEDAEGAA